MSDVKVAVVTGGNRGLGLAIVQELCQKFKGDVYLTARNQEHAKKGAQEIEQQGLKVKYHQLDIEDLESIYKLRDKMAKDYGGIDVLVNNAGFAFKVSDKTSFAKQAAVTMKTNYFGTLHACKALLPIVKAGGRVVNVSSLSSVLALKECSTFLQSELRSNTITQSQLTKKMELFVQLAQSGTHQDRGYLNNSYRMSKIGISVLTEIQARQMVQKGKSDILVNSCCPGWVRTDMGGPKGQKSPLEGADTPVYLALLPADSKEPQGKFLSDRQICEW